MNKSLYIHWGTAKTGTTAIQRFLQSNRERFMNNDLYIPLTGISKSEGSHHPLAFSLCGDKLKSEFYSDLESPVQYMKKMSKEIADISQSRVLLTSEIFPACVNELCGFVREVFAGYEIYIIIYLRRHDHLYESEYIQAVKHGTETRELVEFIKESVKWNYLNFIKRIEHEFSPHKMIIRPYEKGQLLDRNIINDFLYYGVNITIDDEFDVLKEDANPPLSRDAMEFKRIVNQLDIDFNYKNALVKYLVEYSDQDSNQYQSMFKDKKILSPTERIDLIKSQLSDYSKIAYDYCNRSDGILFEEKLPKSGEDWQHYGGLSPYRVLDIYINIMNSESNTGSIHEKVNLAIAELIMSDMERSNYA